MKVLRLASCAGVVALILAGGAEAACAQANSTPAPAAPSGSTDLPVPDPAPSIWQQPLLPAPTLSLHPPLPAPGYAADVGAALSGQFAFPEGRPEELPAHLLVIYNPRSPDSKSLAAYYALRRGIPPERVLGIPCSTDEEITRDQYEKTIREPVISYIYQKEWMIRRAISVNFEDRVLNLLVATHNDVWAIVLMRGVPLRIANDPSNQESLEKNPALRSNAAAVDSELATLPIFGLPIGGFVPNIFFDRNGTAPLRVGPELATKLILVTRLDGPRPADVRRMIDDTLYAEENRLAGGAVVDTRGLSDTHDDYTAGDNWLRRARDLLARAGWPVQFDDHPDVLPATDPCNHVALYLGWYHQGAVGPWITPPNRFVRGAIAYHLHSFSATTVRSATAAWVGPLIAHGAAATMGCVYEPYLDLTPHLDLFTQHLLAGNYFAEAAYASEKGLSWMVTVVGDPLYQPFKKTLDSAVAAGGPASSDHVDALLLQQTRQKLAVGEISNTVESLGHYLDIPGGVAQEGLGDLLAETGESTATAAQDHAYQEAFTLDQQPIDRIRVGLKLARLYEGLGRHEAAQNELKILRTDDAADAARFGVPGPLAALSLSLGPLVLPPARPPVEVFQAPGPPGPPKPPSP